METEFSIAFKSTIDKVGKDMATALGVVNFLDIEDTANSSRVIASDASAIVWRFHTLDENPRDPLYTGIFQIGAKTTTDPSNYTIMDLVSQVKAFFKQGTSIDIYNYSGAVVGAKLGYMFIVQSAVEGQEFDKESGYRFVSIVVQAARDINA